MTFTIRRSILVVLVCWLVVAAGAFVAQRASAASATPVVYVATGENFPDALGAASAAAVQGGPVLLVRQNSIPEATKGELSRLKPDVIYVAGGSDVVSDGVFNALKAYAGSVVRVEGRTRYETAVEVSKSAFPVTGGGGSTAALEARVAQLEALLAGVTRNGETLLLSGMNLQVVNGQGQTNTSNTLGNLIIGYNEDHGLDATRTGSHYLIVGPEHAYTAYGGIVAGYQHTASGDYASVTGGQANFAGGDYASVTGGYYNTASGSYASVTGGKVNTASGKESSVTGGSDNTASGDLASVTGGVDSTAPGFYASVTGGVQNFASGDYASVIGGNYNTASGSWSSVTGGYSNTASGAYDVVVGGDNRVCNYPDAGVCGEGQWWPLD